MSNYDVVNSFDTFQYFIDRYKNNPNTILYMENIPNSIDSFLDYPFNIQLALIEQLKDIKILYKGVVKNESDLIKIKNGLKNIQKENVKSIQEFRGILKIFL